MTAMRSVLGSPWLIVAGAFGVLSYSIASTFTFGVLLIYMQDDFDVGESVIGWIGSIHVFVYFISGMYTLIIIQNIYLLSRNTQ